MFGFRCSVFDVQFLICSKILELGTHGMTLSHLTLSHAMSIPLLTNSLTLSHAISIPLIFNSISSKPKIKHRKTNIENYISPTTPKPKRAKSYFTGSFGSSCFKFSVNSTAVCQSGFGLSISPRRRATLST